MKDIFIIDPKRYPERLNEIPEPPKQLFCMGEIPNPDEYKFLAIVGSRNHTTYGRDVVNKIIQNLAGYPICIVSGLALGIDTLAHTKAIEVRLKTIAIPGSGIGFDVIYPKANINLAKKIIDSGGAIVSEMKPDEKSNLYSFPRRNRIMAGLCDAVLIIEAQEKSGTLITARLALDYNREVFVIPGSIFSENSVGTNKLIKQGATPIVDASEILEFFKFKKTNKDTTPELTPDELKVYKILKEPIDKNELISKLDMPFSEAQSLLTIMEIKCLIKEELGLVSKL